jgi:hypothetical protein
MRGRRSGRLDTCEQSRMGDAFRAPSPAPFEVVTEAAPVSLQSAPPLGPAGNEAITDYERRWEGSTRASVVAFDCRVLPASFSTSHSSKIGAPAMRRWRRCDNKVPSTDPWDHQATQGGQLANRRPWYVLRRGPPGRLTPQGFSALRTALVE